MDEQDSLENLRCKFAPFLSSNPAASLEETEISRGKTEIVIRRPWNDASILFLLHENIDLLADSLNNVYLPEQFTGIWHKNTSELEIIWTHQTLSRFMREVAARSFVFRFKQCAYICSFKRSSDRLLRIARHFAPGG